MIDRDAVQATHLRIEGSFRNWRDADLFVERPQLMVKIACHLTFAVGDAKIDYLTADVPTTQDSADVLAFAGSRIVWVHASGQGSDVSTSIFNTRQIESLVLNRVPNVLAEGFESRGEVEIVLGIEGKKFTLPLSDRAASSNNLELDDYLPTLLNSYAAAV